MQRVAVDDTAGWIRICGVADLIWLESPSNPLLTVADLEAICAAPRKPGAIVAVDNTFATPLNQQPLDFGATVSLQSATKFIGGHSDLLAGVATTKDDALWHALRKSRELTGATPGTLEAFLAVRGARTLALRLQRAQQTAMLLAERLEQHPLVTRVRYPGLPSHPTHATARRVLKGFGTIISFDLRGGAEVADACLPKRAAHPPCHQSRRRGIDHGTTSGDSRPGTPAAVAPAPQRRDRGRGRSLGRSRLGTPACFSVILVSSDGLPGRP